MVPSPPPEDAPPRTAEDVERILAAVLEDIRRRTDPASVRRLEAHWVAGRDSRQRAWFTSVRGSPDPASLGRALNRFKAEVEAAVRLRLSEVEAPAPGAPAGPGAVFDPTMPGRRGRPGGLHPLTLVTAEICRVFAGLGFEVVTGPEVEDPEHNFEGLNIPEGHPARDPSENFTLPGGLLLRSQTSPVQVRVLRSRTPPLRILAPGRVYRKDEIDPTHSPMFHQVEGMLIGRNIGMQHLKGTLAYAMKALFGPGAEVRFRPSYFPFVEPGAEMDVRCPLCAGQGCRVCKGSGWVELLGAGLIHPNVLAMAGIDPAEWSGFAFGMGVERMAMMVSQTPDLRLFFENDLRFLRNMGGLD